MPIWVPIVKVEILNLQFRLIMANLVQSRKQFSVLLSLQFHFFIHEKLM